MFHFSYLVSICSGSIKLGPGCLNLIALASVFCNRSELVVGERYHSEIEQLELAGADHNATNEVLE